MISSFEKIFIDEANECKDKIRLHVKNIRRRDKISVLVKWDGKTGSLTGVINDNWPDAISERFPSLDPKKYVTWYWDQSTFAPDDNPDDTDSINSNLTDTFFTGAASLTLTDSGRTKTAKESDPFLKIAGVKKHTSHYLVKVRYWFVHDPLSSTSGPQEEVAAGDLAEDDVESADATVESLLDLLFNAQENAQNAATTAEKTPADTSAADAKIAADTALQEAENAAEEALSRANEAKADADEIKNTALRYSDTVYPNQDQARFRELFVKAMDAAETSWARSWNSYVNDSTKIHRFAPGNTMLWGVQYGNMGYFAEEATKGLLDIIKVAKTTRPFARGWVAGKKKTSNDSSGAAADTDKRPTASGGASAGTGASTPSAPMCNAAFDTDAFRKKLAVAITKSQTWIDWGKNWFRAKSVDVSALNFAKNRVHRHVTMADGEQCIWRGVMARHDKDIVVFFIDPTNEKLGEVHSIEGWKKEWFTFGGSGGIPAVKPSLNADGESKPDTTKDESVDPEHGPLDKNFTALIARLRDLEARLAPPQAPPGVRLEDTRPARERLAELKSKIDGTRQLIEHAVAGLRQVRV